MEEFTTSFVPFVEANIPELSLQMKPLMATDIMFSAFSTELHLHYKAE